MPDTPLAYHITFGTYGTRLHGDERGTVDRRHNQPGEPILGVNVAWERVEQNRLKYAPIALGIDQQLEVQGVMAAICDRGGWELHTCACQADHVHVLLSSDRDAAGVRRWLKTWLSEHLSSGWPLLAGQSWWAEGGSVRYVWDKRYLEQVHAYVEAQRAGARHGG